MTSARPARHTAASSTAPRSRCRSGSRTRCRCAHTRRMTTCPMARMESRYWRSAEAAQRQGWSSMKSSFRDRIRSQRGYVLITAIVLAILYFALMELMLIDSSRALIEAQRFRSRLVAQTLAESAAELAAVHVVDRAGTDVNAQDEQGKMLGTLKRSDTAFDITGTGTTTGVQPMTATVRVQGKIVGNRLTIDYTYHSQ